MDDYELPYDLDYNELYGDNDCQASDEDDYKAVDDARRYREFKH